MERSPANTGKRSQTKAEYGKQYKPEQTVMQCHNTMFKPFYAMWNNFYQQ